jgi:hypothetical protein
MPAPTLTCLSLSSEARNAAASVHRAELAGADDEATLAGVPADEVLLDPHPAVSSARPHAIATLHRTDLVAIRNFMSFACSRAARRPRLILSGLFDDMLMP